MLKKILITGARAPVALDLARRMTKEGHQVFVADSLKFHLTSFSRTIKKSFYVPAPAKNPSLFIQKVSDICQKEKIDFVIPTCEEIFYIAWGQKKLRKYSSVLCDSFSLLKKLHSKFTFSQNLEKSYIKSPETYLIESKESLEKFQGKCSEFVFKPDFSRFGSYTLIRPPKKKLDSINFTKSGHWVAQEFIPGEEFCSYSLANNGNVLSHVSYKPKHKVGLGAGIYFEPKQIKIIEDFVKNFCETHKFHGQISFDYIRKESGEIYVIECNPRATSGLHLLDPQFSYVSFLNDNKEYKKFESSRNKMITEAFFIFSLVKSLKRGRFSEFSKDFSKADGIIFKKEDPLPILGQFISLFEIICRCFRYKIGLKDASTSDIEWNGEDLD